MKIAKRVFIGLLAVAVLMSGVIAVMAAPGEEPVYKTILEYYDPDTSYLFADESFDGDTYFGEAVNNKDNIPADATLVPHAVGGADKYLQFTAPKLDVTIAVNYQLYHETNVNESRFIYDLSFFASQEDQVIYRDDGVTVFAESKKPTISIVTLEAEGKMPCELITIDYAKGAVKYYGGSTPQTSSMTLTEGNWYNLHIVFDGNGYEFSITDPTRAYNYVESEGKLSAPGASVSKIMTGLYGSSENRNATFGIDNLYVQRGVDYRYLITEELDARTKVAIGEIKDLITSSTVANETKFEAIAIYDSLMEKYTATDDATIADISAIDAGIFSLYAGLLDSDMDKIVLTNDYVTRRDILAANLVYKDRLVTYETTDADVLANIAVYNAEAEKLAQDKSNTEKFMSLVSQWSVDYPTYGYGSETYTNLKNFYDRVVSEGYYTPATGVRTYITSYVTDDGIKAETLVSKFEEVRAAYESLTNEAKTFVDAVAFLEGKVADYNTAVSGGDVNQIASADVARLGAYAAAKACYFDNEECDGIVTALATFKSFDEIAAIADRAAEFVAAMAKAEIAASITSKEERLNLAAEIMNSETNPPNPAYPGVAEAKELYTTLREEIQSKRDAAALYIAAVEEIDGKSGQAFKDAVAAALLLQKTGNIIEIDGVIEANIALDTANNMLLLSRGYANKFISLVSLINNNASMADRYAAITAAAEAYADVDDDTLSGVSTAYDKFADAIAKYKVDATCVNGAYEDAVEKSADLSGSLVKMSDVALSVVSFIKAIIE